METVTVQSQKERERDACAALLCTTARSSERRQGTSIVHVPKGPNGGRDAVIKGRREGKEARPNMGGQQLGSRFAAFFCPTNGASRCGLHHIPGGRLTPTHAVGAKNDTIDSLPE